MESKEANRPIINIGARRVQAEYFERWNAWQMSYFDWLVKTKGVRQMNRYQIVKEDPRYNNIVAISHFDSFDDFHKAMDSPEGKAWRQDQDKAWADKSRVIWYAQYEFMKSFQEGSAVPAEKVETLGPEIGPIIHLEGYSLKTDEQGKHDAWVTKWGHEVYIPWLTRLPGLKEYARYRFLDSWSPYAKVPRAQTEYPPYLSVLCFENVQAYERYEKSGELAAFRDHMNIPFPGGLDFKWYVQYQLIKSWRK